ncbi:heparinase II/III family protein [Cellulophaga sp. HaHaR_3_176]|uniref:heparinase II/III family protein n=1 Tax=Cellulophaga sp. HaHaR_3_176 TaxID=1942464 RepID=UPI001C1F2C06|nr:heparinase II/III family protein [Cellulophaga sp. HaHaR_3_176]QWX85608.1 heparinase II/III family protein [Cellulophaga sp. HaHaR_3_176]
MNKIVIFCFIISLPSIAFSQTFLPSKTYTPPAVDLTDNVLTESELINLLDIEYSPELKDIQLDYKSGNTEIALKKLATYFKEKFSERYYFSWKEFDSRFNDYKKLYPEAEAAHLEKATLYMESYPSSAKWKAPFKNLKGEVVTNYPLRHFTRQHQAKDIALMYSYTKDKKYLNRLPDLAKSLNTAYDKRLVESIKDGNGTYEAYRGGNRMVNWLFAHQVLLASNDYTWQQQIELIRTFLHTASIFYQNHTNYVEGNHQTKGVTALALISMLFPEIKGTDKWQERAFKRIEEHLEKEVHTDGFQFERATSYHSGDILNYFYTYQLAKINHIKLRPIWESRIKGLFDALVKVAMPDKNAPALQDGGGRLGFMNISGTMALGTALFGDSGYNYFASTNVSASHYWFLQQNQLDKLKTVEKATPNISSVIFPETGYYVMRQGWKPDDLYMIINAGLTPEKPDHLHGDILGINGYANETMILPTFTVGYSDKDYPEFKNSWTKNVVQVDSILHGRGWIPNAGRTGFGSWEKLPVPKVLGWNSNLDFDFFAGSHDGYNHVGIKTYRSVYFIKDGFWIVNDQLVSDTGLHTMQQIWQGNYTSEIENKHIKSTFTNGSGLDIVQLGDVADNISQASIQEKVRSVFEKRFEGKANLITLLLPFKNKSIITNTDNFIVNGWQIFSEGKHPSKVKSDAKVILKKDSKYLFIGASEVTINKHKISTKNQKTDLWIEVSKKELSVINCGVTFVNIKCGNQTKEVKSGASFTTKNN